MKPGATMSPFALITRVAAAPRSEPTAAMRSPSTATSAATLGAPLPSTTVPPLMRSDQAMNLRGRLDDLHRLHLVVLLSVFPAIHSRIAGRAAAVDHGAALDEERPGHESTRASR